MGQKSQSVRFEVQIDGGREVAVSRPLNGKRETDGALMERVQRGDQDAFAELYDRHSAPAFRVARAICRDVNFAEDVVQEGFLAIWRSRTRYCPQRGSFRSWAMRVVQNRAIDASRKAATRPRVQLRDPSENPDRPDVGAPGPPEEAIARGERDALLASLRRLPAEQAEVIVLSFFGELSQSEIATQLEVPRGTVKGRMRLGLVKLRYQMDFDAAGPDLDLPASPGGPDRPPSSIGRDWPDRGLAPRTRPAA